MPAIIADREAASSVRTKLNELIEGFNAGVTGAPGSISALTYGWNPATGTAAENATALTAAITAAAGSEVLVPSSVNFLLDPIEITQTADVFLRFVGPGKWDQSTGETGTLGFVNTWADIQAITAFSEVSLTLNGASTTATRISVADESGYALGDVVKVVSQDVDPLAADSAERYRGEFATVVATATGFIYTNLLKDTYTTSPRIGRMPQRTVHIRGLRGIGNLASGRSMVSLQASYKPHIELEQENHGRIVVNSVGSYYGTFIAKASGTTEQGTDSLGYLINDVSGEGNKCYLDGKHFRHVYTSNHNGADAGDIRLERYGRTRKPWVTGVSENSWGAPWDTHPGCENAVFENCISLGGMTGFDNVSAFQLRGLNGTIVNGIDDGSFDSFIRLGGGFGGGTIRVINPQSSSAIILDGTIANASAPTVIWSGGYCTVENRQEMMQITAMDLHVTGGAVFENLNITREFSCVFNLNDARLRTDESVVVKKAGAAVGPGTEARITRFESGTSDWFGAIQLDRDGALGWRSIADQDAGTVKAAVDVDITSGGYVTPTQGTFALDDVRVKTRDHETGSGSVPHRTLANFGVRGNGTTDDSTALNLAFAWLDAAPGRVLTGIPDMTCRVVSALTLPSRGTFDGQGCQFQITENVNAMTADAGHSVYALSADYTKDSLAIPVASTGTALAPGTPIKIVSNADDPGGRDEGSSTNRYRIAEHATVGIGSTTTSLVLTRPLRFVRGISPTSTAGNEARIDAYTTAMNARVVVLDATRKLTLKNFTIAYDDGEEATWSARAITLRWCVRPELENVQVLRGYGAGVATEGTVEASFTRCRWERLENNTGNSQFGYAISDSGYMTNALFCTFVDCRHGYTSNAQNVAADYTSSADLANVGRVVGGKLVACLGKNFGASASPFDTHAGAEDFKAIDCTAEGCAGYGFTIRGRNNHVVGAIIRNGGKGIYGYTGYSSGDDADDFFVNGRSADDFTRMTITNADIQCEDEPIRVATARMIINGGLRIRSATHKILSGSGVVEFSAVGSATVTNFDTAMTLVTDNSTGMFDLDDINSDATAAISKSVLTFTPGADFKVNASAATSTGIIGFSVESNCTVIVEGKVDLEFPTSGGITHFTAGRDVRFVGGGRLTIKRGGGVKRIYSERVHVFELDDNEATSITPPNNIGYMSIARAIDDAAPSNGHLETIAFNAGSTPLAELSGSFASFGSAVAVTTGVLSGQTGLDVRTNVSAHSDGLIYVENRSGALVTYQAQFF